MDALGKAIIRTVAFYDAVNKKPLTKIELYKHLISFSEPISFGVFLERFEKEWEQTKPHITQERGFVFLRANKGAYARRIQTGKTGVKKWRIAMRMIRVISFLPYVRMIALTGSLALQTTHKESDIDVLIVAKAGHIWTTRVLVSAVMQMFGRRRHGKAMRDRICLNHFIADSHLALQPRHLFSAHICSSMIPVWDKQRTAQSFFLSNKSLLETHLPLCGQERGMHLKTVASPSGVFYAISSFLELLLSKTGAKPLEMFLKALQIYKIQHNSAAQLSSSQKGVYTDAALVFHHPRPRHQEALFLYKKSIQELLGSK